MQLSPTECEDVEIRNEISQLKQRLAGTDQELQRTNHTLRLLLPHSMSNKYFCLSVLTLFAISFRDTGPVLILI